MQLAAFLLHGAARKCIHFTHAHSILIDTQVSSNINTTGAERRLRSYWPFAVSPTIYDVLGLLFRSDT